MNTQVLINKITKAISHQYKTDKTTPGLQIAALRNGTFYVSVVRYAKPFGKEKSVVCKAKDPNLDVALKNVASQFLIMQARAKDPVDELNDLINQTELVVPYPVFIDNKTKRDEAVFPCFD